MTREESLRNTMVRWVPDKDEELMMAPPAPVIRDFLPAIGTTPDGADPMTVALVDPGTGIVRTLAWNPALHRNTIAERRTKHFGDEPGIAAAVPQEHYGTCTRMRERGTREGMPLTQVVRENRIDTPRFSMITGDGRNMTMRRYFSGCSDGSHDTDCTASGITPAVLTHHSGRTGLPADRIITGPLATRPGFLKSFVALTEMTGYRHLTVLKREVALFRSP